MKKILSFILIIVCLLSMVACGKPMDNAKKPTSLNTGNTTIEETGEKQNAKYESEHFSFVPLGKMLEHWNYQEENEGVFEPLIEKVNGRILDTHVANDSNYLLTSSGLYEIHRVLFWYEEIDIDIGNNTKIVTVCNNVIVLADDDGNLSVYAPRENDPEAANDLVRWDIPELQLAETDIFVGGKTFDVWDDVYAITNVGQKEMTAKIFGYQDIYTENSTFKYFGEETFNYMTAYKGEEITLSAPVKQYIPLKSMNTPNGFILLEDGQLFYVNPEIHSVYGGRAVFLPVMVVSNADSVWSTYRESVVFTKLYGDTHTIFYSSVLEDENGNYSIEEKSIPLPDGFTTQDIEDVSIPSSRSSYLFVTLKNGDIYMCTDYGTYNDWVFAEDVSNAYKQCGKVDFTDFEGKTAFLFDDGYLYVQLSDEELKQFS